MYLQMKKIIGSSKVYSMNKEYETRGWYFGKNLQANWVLQ